MDLSFLANDNEFNITFEELKNACHNVFLDPCKLNLDNLYSVCSKLNPVILGKFLRYILIPLAAHLSKRDEISCNITNCLTKLARRSVISDVDTFLNLYSLVLKQLQDSNSPESIRATSEELKLEILRCVSQLIKSCSPDVRQSFFDRTHYSKLSVGVFLCTRIAVNENFTTLKIEALNCLMLLTHVSDELPFDDSFKPQLASVVMLMIPGISTTCLNIINNGDIHNHKPIILSLQLWSRVVALVMSDNSKQKTTITFSLGKSNINSQNDHFTSTSKFNNPEEFVNALNGIKHNKEWIKTTDKNLSSITQRIVDCQTHQHWRVRLALAKASYKLLDSCGMNMSQSIGYLAEALTYLSQDGNETVSEFSKKCISDLCENLSEKRLVDLIEENFYSLLTRLPRILRGADITMKEKQLILICGFLDILGSKNVPAVLSSIQHLNRFLHCLIVSATPDCRSVTLLEEVAIRGIDVNNYSSEPKWRQLKYCDNAKCETVLKNICAKLVQYSDFEMLMNSLLDDFNYDTSNRKNILVLFIYLFSSGTVDDFKSYSSLLKDVISTLMEPSLWNIAIDINEEVTNKLVIQENIVQICLLAEVIGCLAVATGPVTFLPLLLQCLYPVLECAGSPLSMISTAGQVSLHKLACLYEGSSVSTLISRNVDYLSHHVMLKLRQAHRNPRVLSVLSVIMEYSSLSMLSSLHDIINDVLVQSCDMFQDINGNAFLYVFHTYLTCIKKWTKTNSPKVETKKLYVPEIETEKIYNIEHSEVISELLRYKECLIAADVDEYENLEENFSSQCGLSEEEMEVNHNEEEKKVKIPDHINLTKEILTRSLHFLPANNISRQILVLQILDHGTEILSEWTDVLLPIVHKMWSPLVQRFKSSNHPLLLQRAFSLLKTLAKYSKDFIRARTVKEVMPSLCKVLKDSSEESKKRDPTGAFKLTQLYKLQLLLLNGLAKLSEDMEFNTKQIYPILKAATPYLSQKQPLSLQEMCIELYKDISKVYPDLVWTYLMSVCPTQLEFKAPIADLHDYKLKPGTHNTAEYFNNVNQIIQIL